MVATDVDSADRLTASERRDALLDVAREMVLDGGSRSVTMGSVAARAGVARALVYKHFANKEEALNALYLREAAAIDRAIRHEVAAAPDGFEPKLRAYVAGVIEHVADTAPVFAPLNAVSANAGYDRAQRSWDKRTVAYFGGLAAERFGLTEADAKSAVSMLLGGFSPLLAQVRATSNPDTRAVLQERYVALVIGGLDALRP